MYMCAVCMYSDNRTTLAQGGAVCRTGVDTDSLSFRDHQYMKLPRATSLLRGRPHNQGLPVTTGEFSLSHTLTATILPNSHYEWLTLCPGFCDIHSLEACCLYAVNSRCYFIAWIPHTGLQGAQPPPAPAAAEHRAAPRVPHQGRWSGAQGPSSPTRPDRRLLRCAWAASSRLSALPSARDGAGRVQGSPVRRQTTSCFPGRPSRRVP